MKRGIAVTAVVKIIIALLILGLLIYGVRLGTQAMSKLNISEKLGLSPPQIAEKDQDYDVQWLGFDSTNYIVSVKVLDKESGTYTTDFNWPTGYKVWEDKSLRTVKGANSNKRLNVAFIVDQAMIADCATILDNMKSQMRFNQTYVAFFPNGEYVHISEATCENNNGDYWGALAEASGTFPMGYKQAIILSSSFATPSEDQTTAANNIVKYGVHGYIINSNVDNCITDGDSSNTAAKLFGVNLTNKHQGYYRSDDKASICTSKTLVNFADLENSASKIDIWYAPKATFGSGTHNLTVLLSNGPYSGKIVQTVQY